MDREPACQEGGPLGCRQKGEMELDLKRGECRKRGEEPGLGWRQGALAFKATSRVCYLQPAATGVRPSRK